MTDYLRPPPGATCQEVSPFSHQHFVECGRPATLVVKTRDPEPYAMCSECADHNVRHRAASYVLADGSLARTTWVSSVVSGGGGAGGPFPPMEEPETQGRSLAGAILALAVVLVFALIMVGLR